MLQSQNFGIRSDGEIVTAHALESENGFRAVILNHGAILQSLHLPNGQNVALGFQNWAEYQADQNYIGRIIGPNANRIAQGSFRIGDKEFVLKKNDGAHNLHSGPNGFDTRLWDVSHFDHGIELNLKSNFEQTRFPGDSEIKLQISFVGNRLRLEMEAHCDRPTPFNMTWHPYWNLSPKPQVNDHYLTIDSHSTTLLEAGTKQPIENTQLDFRKDRRIGNVKLDHNYTNVREATLKNGGVSLTVSSSLPDMQIYTGDALKRPRRGIAIEPQFQPNDINFAQRSLVRPGDVFEHWIEYRFDLT